MGPYPFFGMIVLFVGIIMLFGCVVSVNTHYRADLFVGLSFENGTFLLGPSCRSGKVGYNPNRVWSEFRGSTGFSPRGAYHTSMIILQSSPSYWFKFTIFGSVAPFFMLHLC